MTNFPPSDFDELRSGMDFPDSRGSRNQNNGKTKLNSVFSGGAYGGI